MEKQVVYSEAIGSKQRGIAAMMKDVGVIAVERKEVAPQIGAAKSRDDVSKEIQKEKQREIEVIR